MWREKKIHLLRQFSILLPSFSLKQRSASCATGEDTVTFHQPIPGKTLPALPASDALLWRAGGEKRAGIWKWWHLCLLPSWEPAQLQHLCHRIHVTKSSVRLDKVASNFKATFILYATALQFCIPGFMKQRQRKMRWQSAEICRRTCDLL